MSNEKPKRWTFEEFKKTANYYVAYNGGSTHSTPDCREDGIRLAVSRNDPLLDWQEARIAELEAMYTSVSNRLENFIGSSLLPEIEKIKEHKERIAELEEQKSDWSWDVHSTIGDALKEHKERIATLEAALEFYADPENWFGGEDDYCYINKIRYTEREHAVDDSAPIKSKNDYVCYGGATAREALAKGKE